MKLKSVEFVKQWGSYNKGDVAGFEPEKAGNLVKAKVAKAFTAPSKSKQDS